MVQLNLKKMLQKKMINNNFLILIFLLITFNANQSFAKRNMVAVDYYASIKSKKTNVRAGPGYHYPIKFTYVVRNIPIKVINEFDNWVEIEDYENHHGWVSQSLTTKARTVMINTNKERVKMYKKPDETSKIIFYLENKVIGRYIKCNDEWCKIEINKKEGWVSKLHIFGY